MTSKPPAPAGETPTHRWPVVGESFNVAVPHQSGTGEPNVRYWQRQYGVENERANRATAQIREALSILKRDDAEQVPDARCSEAINVLEGCDPW